MCPVYIQLIRSYRLMSYHTPILRSFYFSYISKLSLVFFYFRHMLKIYLLLYICYLKFMTFSFVIMQMLLFHILPKYYQCDICYFNKTIFIKLGFFLKELDINSWFNVHVGSGYIFSKLMNFKSLNKV